MDGLFSWSRCNKLNDSAVPIPIPQLLDASIGKGREQIGRARVQQPYVPARRGRAVASSPRRSQAAGLGDGDGERKRETGRGAASRAEPSRADPIRQARLQEAWRAVQCEDLFFSHPISSRAMGRPIVFPFRARLVWV